VSARRVATIGVLLAGGAARRFRGLPKGLARIDGQRIADRALAVLRAAADGVIVVANDPHASTWFPCERVVADETPGLGPLAGLATALEAAGGAAVLVVGWDMPFVTASLLRELRRRGEAGATAVVPVHGPHDVAEPLCAWYAPAALASCRALLAAGSRRADSLLGALPHAVRMGETDLAPHGVPARLFISVDTLEQLAALGGTMDEEAG
jgi:molybdopterin-guanine dinucleotide biosynthesis protein A